MSWLRVRHGGRHGSESTQEWIVLAFAPMIGWSCYCQHLAYYPTPFRLSVVVLLGLLAIAPMVAMLGYDRFVAPRATLVRLAVLAVLGLLAVSPIIARVVTRHDLIAGLPTSAVAAAAGLLAMAAVRVLDQKRWARPVLLGALACAALWYLAGLAMNAMGLAGGALADDSRRLEVAATFATFLAGLAVTGWLLYRIGLMRSDDSTGGSAVP